VSLMQRTLNRTAVKSVSLSVVGALAGCLLLAMMAMLATYRHTHPGSGIGAVAGGL
jgi:hypothetical protein